MRNNANKLVLLFQANIGGAAENYIGKFQLTYGLSRKLLENYKNFSINKRLLIFFTLLILYFGINKYFNAYKTTLISCQIFGNPALF
jgi:hypothetical protein